MPRPLQHSRELAQPRNLFELRLISWPSELRLTQGASIAVTGLGLQLWVDGQHIDEPHPIDLLLLVQSLHQSGWFDIFTCGCGVGACAGIVEGIEVTHEMGMVRWSLRRPQSAGSLSDSMVSNWEKTAIPVIYKFERRQMIAAIQKCLQEISALVDGDLIRFDWCVNGPSIQEILNIDPSNPVYEILSDE